MVSKRNHPQMALIQVVRDQGALLFPWFPKLPRSFVLELAAPIWDSSLLEAQSASLKMRLAALFWGWQPHSEAS